MELLKEDTFDASSSSSSWLEVSLLSRDPIVLLASERPKKRVGRRVFKETRHPVYRGVRQRNKDRWVCEVCVLNGDTRIWLGTYSTAEMAARAHDVAALALCGKLPCLNFADSAWRLPLPESTNAADIRREGFRANLLVVSAPLPPLSLSEHLGALSGDLVFKVCLDLVPLSWPTPKQRFTPRCLVNYYASMHFEENQLALGSSGILMIQQGPRESFDEYLDRYIRLSRYSNDL
ncbi:dehydration-responsive element-binding protein 1G-like [Neltuma alba]|uniref:dehydration-responsive element-binding protein 1G-like n=1 Tax=Neltuma alba TaxID=207710 RepID=UPI0010A592D8|nr:dehydration-responsive element-binding protein 1G-like [Prosopis alba]